MTEVLLCDRVCTFADADAGMMRDPVRRSIGCDDASMSRSNADDEPTETSNLSIAGLVGWESSADAGDRMTHEPVERTILLKLGSS
jgi:hypothetical protein